MVALASEICDVPVSLISLVDDQRQWFKARVGFEPDQTTLDQSICSHAILEDGFLEIENLAEDPRSVDNPLHQEGPKVGFYAGASLVAPNGMPIGTLCVLDNKPRKLNDFQRKALRTLSRQVMVQLELRKKLAQEEALKSEMDHRVRNSLQTIASVMRVASRQVTDPKALDVLEVVERRIGAVSSLHSELMGRDGKSTIEIQPYLERLLKLLADVAPENVTLSGTSVDEELEAPKASALGMIVSEFAANSVKHAFPDGQRGRVTMSLTREDAQHFLLVCRDDGVGRKPAAEVAGNEPKHTGLGDMLMSAAATQMGGHLEVESGEGGTSLTVRFIG
ncbi:MAG: histidine kinase dimerization/phosphoacceptor domain -containing protein [Sulfitobacter sp.]